MRWLKRAFVGYVMLAVLVVAGLAVTPMVSRPRDPRTLHLTYGATIQTLDPFVMSDAMTASMVADVYESLYASPYADFTGRMVPVLAAAMPEVSDGGLTYTIRIRRGSRFYDPSGRVFAGKVGRELTAHDVVYTMKRLADFRMGAPGFGQTLEGRVEGVEEFRKWSESAGGHPGEGYEGHEISGIRAVDDFTVRFRFTKPYPLFEFFVSWIFIVCPEAYAVYGDAMPGDAVGTGPYYLEEYRNGQRMVLRRNPVYGGAAETTRINDVPLGMIERVQYDFAPEALPLWHLFLQGRYDVAAVPKEVFESVMNPDLTLKPEYAGRGIVADVVDRSNVIFLQFNFADKLLAGYPELRRAMSLAVDREKLVELYLSGCGTPARGLLPLTSPAIPRDYRGPWNRYDPELARKFVREAEMRYGGPLPTLTISFGDTDSDTRQRGEFLLNAFRAVGLSVRGDYCSWARALERQNDRDYQIFESGWNAGPDEYTFLNLFDKAQIPPPNYNMGNYYLPAFQELLDRSAVMRPTPERDAMYREMARLLDDDLPVISLYYPKILTLRTKRVGNYVPSPAGKPPVAYLTLKTN